MKRKNFLRQMAVTLPVGLAAPQMLFAGTANEAVSPETVLHISDETAGSIHELVAGYPELKASSIATLQFDKGSFLVTDNSGKKTRAAKLIFSGEVAMKSDFQNLVFHHAPSVSVEFGESKKSAGLLSLNSYQLPQYHVRKSENFREENLKQFIGKQRPGVLRLV
jgi:hypothetical protein